MVTLSSAERNVIKNLCVNNLVYSLIQQPDITAGLKQCEYIKVFPEQLFLETIDIIDSIRELEYEQSRLYAASIYDKLLVDYAEHANCQFKNYVDIKHKALDNDVRLLASLLVFISACAILLSKSQFATELYQTLIKPLTGEQNQYFVKVFKQPLNNLSDLEKTNWREYYNSDKYLSENILNELDKINNCMYIQPENIIQTGARTVDEYTDLLQIACEDSAPALVSFLKRGRDLQYLDFYKHNAKQVFETLHKSFPSMRLYSYQNFVAECKKAGLKFS